MCVIVYSYIGALVDVLAGGLGPLGRGQQPLPARAAVRAGRVAALSAAAGTRAAPALVYVAARPPVRAEVPPLPADIAQTRHTVTFCVAICHNHTNIVSSQK